MGLPRQLCSVTCDKGLHIQLPCVFGIQAMFLRSLEFSSLPSRAPTRSRLSHSFMVSSFCRGAWGSNLDSAAVGQESEAPDYVEMWFPFSFSVLGIPRLDVSFIMGWWLGDLDKVFVSFWSERGQERRTSRRHVQNCETTWFWCRNDFRRHQRS